MFVNFVDIRKAFDSIHQNTLWDVMRHYGLPQKIVSSRTTPSWMHLSLSRAKRLPLTNIGSVISNDQSAQKDIKSRFNKGRNAFANLRPIWRSSVYIIIELKNSILSDILEVIHINQSLQHICTRK